MPDELTGTPTPTAAPTATPTPAGAPGEAAPIVTVGEKGYTAKEAQEALSNYQKLQGEYTRATQQLSAAAQAVEFANWLEEGGRRDAFLRWAAENAGAEGAVPQGQQPSQQPGEEEAPSGLTRQEVENIIQTQFWANQQWSSLEGEFPNLTGRPMTPQDRAQVQSYLYQTGAADLRSAALAVFHNDIMKHAAVAQTEAAKRAQAVASGAVAEGGTGEVPSVPIDWSKPGAVDEAIRRGRAQAGGTVDQGYNPYEGYDSAR